MQHRQVRLRRSSICSSAATSLAAIAAIALAPAAACAGTAPPQSPLADVASESNGIGEIVVTAQKRSESLQKTAAAVTALSGSELIQRGVNDLRAAQMVIPAARFNNENNNTQVFVRGVGSSLDFPNVEPSVAFNFNGIFMPREATSTAFFDIESMEVLPGPQGTLYGRGAMGGTVNVNFKRPGFDNAGTAQVEAGNFNLIHATLAQDLKISDSFAVRVAGDYVNHDGYFTSGAHSADDIAGRISLVYEPQGTFSAYVWASYAEKNGKAPNVVNHAPGSPTYLTDNPWDDLQASAITNQLYDYLTGIGVSLPFTVGQVRAEDANYHVFSAGGEFNLDLGASISLTYLPGYVSLDSKPFYWVGSLLFTLPAKYEVQSHELRLAGNSGAVKWLGGLFYYHQKNSGLIRNYYSGIGSPLVQQGFEIDKSIVQGFGIFGQATARLSDQFRATVGGRYSEDKRTARGFSPEYLFGGGVAASPWAFRKKYTHFDWKAGVEFDVAPQIMLYAGAQTGYAPGTYNPISQARLDAGDPFINPGTPYDGTVDVKQAKLLAISGGMKSRFLDDKVQFNIEGFHYKYNDLMQQQFNVAYLYNPLFSADEVEIYGVQADLLVKPTANDRLSVSVGYTHARNKKFVTPNGTDYSGLQAPYAPDWTVLGSYTHTFEIGASKVDATVSARYESSWWADFAHDPGTQQEANARLDASLTYISDNRWRLGIWGKNLTNKAVIGATAAAGFPGPASGFLDIPRTYGLRFQIDY